MTRNDQVAGASLPALEVHSCGSDVEITGIRDFDLDHIFDCGQCFRWNRGEDGSYTEPAIDPVWWTQDFSLSWRTM